MSLFTFLGPILGDLAVANTIGEFVKLDGIENIPEEVLQTKDDYITQGKAIYGCG